jgi:hypothetical protein
VKLDCKDRPAPKACVERLAQPDNLERPAHLERREISRSDPDGTLSPIRQFNHYKPGTAARSLLQYRKPVAKQAMPRIRDRYVSYVPIKVGFSRVR